MNGWIQVDWEYVKRTGCKFGYTNKGCLDYPETGLDRFFSAKRSFTITPWLHYENGKVLRDRYDVTAALQSYSSIQYWTKYRYLCLLSEIL